MSNIDLFSGKTIQVEFVQKEYNLRQHKREGIFTKDIGLKYRYLYVPSKIISAEVCKGIVNYNVINIVKKPSLILTYTVVSKRK